MRRSWVCPTKSTCPSTSPSFGRRHRCSSHWVLPCGLRIEKKSILARSTCRKSATGHFFDPKGSNPGSIRMRPDSLPGIMISIMGLPGFEPESETPEAPRMDQTTPQTHWLPFHISSGIYSFPNRTTHLYQDSISIKHRGDPPSHIPSAHSVWCRRYWSCCSLWHGA